MDVTHLFFLYVAPFLFIPQTNGWNTCSIGNGVVQLLYTYNFYALVSGMDLPTIHICNISLSVN